MIGTASQYSRAQRAYDSRMPIDEPECPECGAQLIIDRKGAQCSECDFSQRADEFE